MNLSFDSTSDEFNITEDEIEQVEKEAMFVAAISQDISSIKMGDWILAKFCPRKVNKFYVGQITETEPGLEAKFARRMCSSNYFHWPDVEDNTLIRTDEIFLHLPNPTFDERGKFEFDISFDSYDIL